MPETIDRIVIGYGSESGNARGLVQRLLHLPFLQPFELAVQDLNALMLDTLTPRDRLIIVSSSFGDGDPPANAEYFIERIANAPTLRNLSYAIFGLGDTAYPTFCGFTKTVDAALLAGNAVPFMNRVDADSDFEAFFETWCTAFHAVLQGNPRAGTTLRLQVKAYGEHAAYPARVIARTQLNQSPPFAFHLRLDIEGSGIKYRAGDNLYVLATNEPDLLSHLVQWFDNTDVKALLENRELRQVSKSTLREIAKTTQNEDLKGLLKVSQRKALEEYLYGKDILDILTDFCDPHSFTPQDLAQWLPQLLPRAYSIASHDNTTYVDVCFREINYSLSGRQRKGAATGYLTSQNPTVKIFARSNPRFHLPKGVDHPLVLIGTGTGIAPLIALLEQLGQENHTPQTCLVFGDRRRASDFLYKPKIDLWKEKGILNKVLTAFSRDGEARYYVQDAIVEHGAYIWGLLEAGAHLYLCGNKSNLERSINQALATIAITFGHLTEEAAGLFVEDLEADNRLHKELY
jgi:sulfite reductase (NADPH) flavoprotein alpha-component